MSESQPTPTEDHRSSLWPLLATYTLARIGLLVVLTVVLAQFVPLLVAMACAVAAQLPLSWALFSGLRRRTNQALAERTAQRRAERERLQAALAGPEEPTP